ncbi:hypothetical protein AYO20_06671 [Fonsecaea nubica]|uniref:HTH CENPB-type domain-containing protein n=1 Tax=Fonsecaea nubica TaxID=856822 RepID=A0A178CY62_9EURO|nr:hypothetical protein AYO20_06671 [Fonsecaea nubica]OAL34023.1 hypothetical protein AYO20_06671 [Fonsecaea nubica]
MSPTRETGIQQAITDYRTRKYPSIRACATANEVNYATLSRRLKGSTQSATLSHEPQQLLSNAQEVTLKGWILDLEALSGKPLSFDSVNKLAGILSTTTGGSGLVGHNWLPRFIRRHPDIRSKVGPQKTPKQ